jgi:tRNA A37 threonylcarbamoyladenosine modification protein TsaB
MIDNLGTRVVLPINQKVLRISVKYCGKMGNTASMKCLYIDLASKEGIVACVTDTVAASQDMSNKISDGELIPIVEGVIKEAGWKLSDLTHITCAVGPGGFTSLRVSVTFANVLADQLGIPSAGVHLSEVYTKRTEEDAYWMHSTKKDQLFVCGGQWEEPTLITVNEIPCGNWMGELLEDHEKASGAEQVALTPINDVLPGIVESAQYSKEILHPWYGRGW